MHLYVVRHGETEYNAQGRYAGSTDVPLNDTGIRQAVQLSQQLAGIPFDVIVSSPLWRARQTADIISASRNIRVLIMDGLAERNMGVYEGLTRAEAAERYPALWHRLRTRNLDDAPTGGEAMRQVDTRVSAALQKIKDAYGDKCVLIVCHGFVSRVINRYCKDLTFDEMDVFMLDNCEVAEYIL